MGTVRVLHQEGLTSNGDPRARDVRPLVIIGAGIHGVHLATSLIERNIGSPSELTLVDPHPEPLFVWEKRVRNCGMPYLRSPASHGLAPDFRNLRSYMQRPSDYTTPYHRPSIEVFRRHARDRLDRFAGGIDYRQGMVQSITRNRDGTFSLALAAPRTQEAHRTFVTARTVILAPGPTATHVPEALRELRDTHPAVSHVYDSAFDPDHIQAGERVLIVGGGIAALHLALLLRHRPVDLTVWTRDPIPVHQYDSDPCFVGPRCEGILGGLSAADSDTTRAIVFGNRRPGSVPRDLKRDFLRASSHKEFLHRYVDLKSAVAAGDQLCVTGLSVSGKKQNGGIERGEFDRVIACTGFAAGPPVPNLVRQMARDLAAPLGAGGFPLPSVRDLAWVPGVYLSGGLADLVLGPPARNIIGAHLARRRIFSTLSRAPGGAPVDYPLNNSRSS